MDKKTKETIDKKLSETTDRICVNNTFNTLTFGIFEGISILIIVSMFSPQSILSLIIKGAVLLVAMLLAKWSYKNQVFNIKSALRELKHCIDVASDHREKTLDEIMEEESEHIPTIE